MEQNTFLESGILLTEIPELPQLTSADGSPIEFGNWVSTDFVKVDAYAGFYYLLAANRMFSSLAFFDADRKFLSSVVTESTCSVASVRNFIKRPENAVYAKWISFLGVGDMHNKFCDTTVYAFPTEEAYEREKAKTRFGKLKVVCLGDSLTEGDYGTDRHGIGKVYYRNYPFYLSELLRCETVNYGKCGFSAKRYLPFFDEHVSVSDADVVFLMLGTNDGITCKGTEQKACYYLLIDRIRKHLKEGARLILITPPHTTEIEGKPNYGFNSIVKNAHDEILKIAGETSLPVIDVYLLSPFQEENEALYQPNDGLHLADAGYRALARYLAVAAFPQFCTESF